MRSGGDWTRGQKETGTYSLTQNLTPTLTLLLTPASLTHPVLNAILNHTIHYDSFDYSLILSQAVYHP